MKHEKQEREWGGYYRKEAASIVVLFMLPKVDYARIPLFFCLLKINGGGQGCAEIIFARLFIYRKL